MTGTVNRWVEPAWARRYLGERDAIPHRSEGVTVFGELLPERVERVLDLGTGDGFLLGVVRDLRPECTGVGVDFSEEMLGRARERFAGDPSVEIREQDLSDPLADDLTGFDLVVSSFAIHHVSDARKRALYGEVFDRLQPGGTFLNLEHVASATEALHVEFLAAIGKTPAEDDPSNQLAPVGDQVEWLRDLGFVDVECFWKWRELALLGGRRPA